MATEVETKQHDREPAPLTLLIPQFLHGALDEKIPLVAEDDDDEEELSRRNPVVPQSAGIITAEKEELPEDWWKRYEPPKELTVVDDSTPAEIVAEVNRLEEFVREQTKPVYHDVDDFNKRYFSRDSVMLAVPENLPAVNEATESSPTNSTDTQNSSTPSECRLSVRKRLSRSISDANSSIRPTVHSRSVSASDSSSLSQSLSRRLSMITTRSTNSSMTSISLSNNASPSRSVSVSPSTMTAKQNVPPNLYLTYGPAYTASSPNKLDILPPLLSPRAEAVKRFWKSRKAESECSSCLEDHRDRKLTALSCRHKYCAPCLRKLILTAMADESRFPPKCCIGEIPIKAISNVLSRSLRAAFKEKIREYLAPPGERIYCPRPACASWIPPSSLKQGSSEYRCSKCRQKVCRFCKGVSHDVGTDCPEDTGLAAVLDQADRQGWKRCYQCRALVELTEGCIHITCKCKAEFCYVCTNPWKTCDCRGDEEEIRRANQINHELEALEHAEEGELEEDEELRAAIAASIALQRQEETLEQPEQPAVTEQEPEPERQRHEIPLWQRDRERREREAARKKTEEEARMKALNARFQGLHTALEDLHAAQRALMVSRHQRELRTIELTRVAEEKKLDAKLRDRESKARDEGQRALEAMRKKHLDEKSELLLRQATEEDDYWFGLRFHLRGKPNRDAREKALVDKLHAQQADELAEFAKACEQESQELQQKMHKEWRETIVTLDEEREDKRKSLRSEMQEDSTRRQAERTWFKFVVDERRMRLAARQQQLMDGDQHKRRELLDTYLRSGELDG